LVLLVLVPIAHARDGMALARQKIQRFALE